MATLSRVTIEIQENSFKRMVNNGALNVNFGIKKVVGPDRHKERKLKKLEDPATKVGQKIENKKRARSTGRKSS